MNRVLILLVAINLGGCATARLGTQYNPDAHGLIETDAGRVLVYPDRAVDEAIYFYVDIDGEHIGRLFQETFLSSDQDPGELRIRVREYWTGDGFGKGFAEIFTKPFDDPDPNLPPSLNARGATFLTIDIEAGKTTYLRLRKIPEERLYQCEDTEQTTTICARDFFRTEIELVTAAEAEAELAGYQESL